MTGSGSVHAELCFREGGEGRGGGDGECTAGFDRGRPSFEEGSESVRAGDASPGPRRCS